MSSAPPSQHSAPEPLPIMAEPFAGQPQNQPKVLFFYQDFGAMGGIERYLIQTARWLRERGQFEPVIACCEVTPLYTSLQAEGISVYGLPNRQLFSKSFLRSLDVFTFFRLYRILKAEKPQLVHVHIGLLEVLLFKLLGYPVVYTFHGYDTLYSSQETGSPLKKGFKALTRWLFQKTARGVDALLFVSRAEQARMLTEGYLPATCPGDVLYNGLPISELQSEVKGADRSAILASLGLPPDARCVSYINRLDENKNPFQFIELARQLSAEAASLHSQPDDKPLHFLLAGDGPLAPLVEAECQHVPNLHYLGFRSDVTHLLAISEIVIYPAGREGFGLGLVEAMAAGSLCVAYASGGAQEILGGPETSDCLVPIGDFEGLLSKTRALLQASSAETGRMTQALQARASDFDSSRFIEGLEAVYRNFTPKVSVILPVYNGESIVLRAVHSVLGQTYAHLELIVVDDGSQDGTLAQLATIQDPRLKVVPQANQGVAVARNHGFQYATGDYIAFIDADDIWLRHKLAVELATIRKQAGSGHVACLVYSSYYAVDESDRLINLPGIFREQGDLSQAVLEHEGIFLPSTALAHRSVFEAVGGFKQACYHEDRVFFIEACQNFPAYATGQRLVIYRQSLSGRCRAVLKHYEEALAAELSIVETLMPTLPPLEIGALSARQMRNLVYRFLMYGYAEPAKRLYQQLQTQDATPGLFDGRKGQLALLSLKTGINFLVGARLFIQSMTRHGLQPWWAWKMQNYT